jgi:predicted methyltransferase
MRKFHCSTIHARVACAAVVLLAACTSLPPADPGTDAARYAGVVANPLHTDQDRQLDAERKPAEFLRFAQVKPGMRVLDVSSGGGYTSQLLALAVGPAGTLFAQTPRPGATLVKRLAEHPQANFILVERPFDDPVPPEAPPLDLVTLVLNYHDLTYQPVDRAAMNAHLFAALKPGGHFVVIDHSSRAGKGISEGRTLHRIDEAVVVDEVRKAGFVVEQEGDFLRNPADPRDESSNRPKVPTDKFALRFVKPR